MKQLFNQTMQLCIAISFFSFSTDATGQIKPVRSISPVTVSRVKITGPESFNKSISPEYINSTKKFLKTSTKSLISKTTRSSPRSTVNLNRGGTEGSAPSQTTVSNATQDGSYSCVVRKVNEKTDYFRQPIFGQSEFIYPGALMDASKIINNQLSYFALPASYQRNPYRISANLFTMAGPPQSPSEMIGDNEDYSQASFRDAKSLIMNRNANANPPVEVFVEYIEATTQEEVSVKLGYNFSANVPAELTAMLTGIPIGANMTASASAVANQINDKSRLILKVNFNFYSIDASPTNDNVANFLTPVAGAGISNNVVYVSSVLYGTTGYVYFESDKSMTELIGVISETVGVSGPANQGSASIGVSAETRAKFTSTVTKMVAYGKGLGVQPGSSLQLTSLDNLLSLIGSLKSWGPDNQGSPIAYTMNFIKDGVQAVVSYSTQFENKVCTQPELTDMKFDVELELERFDVANVRDLDGTEDLYGQIDFRSLKAGTKTNNNTVALFTKTESNANNNNYRNGSNSVDKRIKLIANLSFDELRNLELTVGGKLLDDEGVLGSREFKCVECVTVSGIYGKRTLKLIELVKTQNALNSILNNGQFQSVRFGDDNFFELNFFESGKAADGKVKFLFKLWVKPHQ